MGPMTVSERDRLYMDRIGRLKAASHAEADARHRSLSLGERLQRSWELFLAWREHTARSPSDEAPPAIHSRARALGLYRP